MDDVPIVNSATVGLAILAFFACLHTYVDVSPLEREWFHYPQNTIRTLTIIVTIFFNASAIMSARRTAWKMDDSLSVVAVFVGVFIGMTSKLDKLD
jgi:uncharacterized membrane protein required for colicin V production